MLNLNQYHSTEYKELKKAIELGDSVVSIYGLWPSALAQVVYSLNQDYNRPVMVVTPTDSEAKKMLEDISFFSDKGDYFPSKEVVFFDAYAHSNQLIHQRVRSMREAIAGDLDFVTLSVEAMMMKLPPRQLFASSEVTIDMSSRIDLGGFAKMLFNMGYERTEIVESPGHFAIRGGIIDIFTIDYEHPIRIELFDDEVDSIRTFDINTQLSIDKIKKVCIGPCREMVMDEAIKENAIKTLSGLSEKASDVQRERMEQMVNGLEEDIFVDGLDRFNSVIYEESNAFTDYLDNPLVVIWDHHRIFERFTSVTNDYEERFKSYLEKGMVMNEQYPLYFTESGFLACLKSKQVILSDLLTKRIIKFRAEQIIHFRAMEAPSYYGKLDALKTDIGNWRYKGYKLLIVLNDESRKKRVEKILSEMEVSYSDYDVSEQIQSGQVCLTVGHLEKGFVFGSFKFVILTEHELYGIKKKAKRKKAKKGRLIKSFNELTVGDFIVHEAHGIGKYIGVEQLKVDDVKRDYIKIKYSGDDFLYIPVEQMELIQKYVGQEVTDQRLNKLGGTEWKKTKAKVKKAIEDMTDELLGLYAERKNRIGYAFSPDNDWQMQFEEQFPYEETGDQLKCIEEIKVDMQKAQPMERLLCGDVGYGKTEVAIRAIFKAVLDSKQVAFLVPTTILAQQHYNNLRERFSKFPATVEMLSRFRTPKQQEKIMDDVRSGVVDVLVGTHRILSKDIDFKDIGLLIIDEEQRFGVKHKEALKKLKSQVDVLTLTATPIPRTLHMSLIGVRDMSVIEDPPEDRFPIQTYVAEFDGLMIKEAMQRELDRGGQVYFVHNRVHDIDQVTAQLQNMVPDADVRFAHGQMSEVKLEKIMMDFLNHEFDVLVCTTIIETGLDISNVNTIIINDSDRLGLSQLYQLRGRVGRSNRVAYCYALYQRDKVLSEIAEKRLKALKEFTELGSGFKIAMKDLEIRGAGNILGAQQHGHMAQIGYDLYCKLLEESVSRIKGEVVEETFETAIDFTINAFLPKRYIVDPKLKLDVYKKISVIRNKEDAIQIEEEIEDRFGTIPTSVYNLIDVAYLRAIAHQLKIVRISGGTTLTFTFLDTKYMAPEMMERLGRKYASQVKFNGMKPIIQYRLSKRTLTDREKLLEVIGLVEIMLEFI